MAPFEFTDSSIVVLGGTGALGRRIAERLAERRALVTVSGRDANKAELIARSIGGTPATFDFTDGTTLLHPLEQALASHGSIDGIINAAGVVAFGHHASTSRAVIDRLLAVNLNGPLALYAAAIPMMDSGFIANLTGIVATMPTAGMVTYSASKAGLSAATIALARELRREGITVIDARPPHTETGLAERALSGEPPRLAAGLHADVVADRLVEGLALGRRVLEPEWFQGAD